MYTYTFLKPHKGVEVKYSKEKLCHTAFNIQRPPNEYVNGLARE